VTVGFLLGSGWIVGTAVAIAAAPRLPWLAAAAAALAPAAVAAALFVRPARYALAIAAALVGLARAELPGTDPAALARAPAYAGMDVIATGTVADDPRDQAAGWEAVLAPGSVASRSGPLPAVGELLVTARGHDPPAPGDAVRVRGRLRLPRESPGFDRRAQLAGEGVGLELVATTVDQVAPGPGWRAIPWRLREGYRAAIASLLPEPYAGLLVGVVLGVRTGIPTRLREQLIATGLVHLLVLSGLKVAVFMRLAAALVAPLPARLSTWPLLALVGLYALVGGATPAGIRAAAMGALVVLGTRLGRPAHVWTSLALAGAAMVAWKPGWVGDVGFLLSFLGTAAIVLLTPAFEHRLGWIPPPFREPFAVTCAAQAGTLPVGIAGFQLISPVAPLANALVLPLLPAMVALGLLVTPFAIVPAAGRLLALPVAAMLAWLQQVAAVLASVPGASLPIPRVPATAGLAYYAVIGGVVGALTTDGRRRAASIALAILLPALLGGGELTAWLRSSPSADVLDVGDGQAVLVTGPAGHVLIDGGPSPARLAAALGERLPPWPVRFDAIFVTSSALGHVGGLAGFDRPTARVYLPASPLPGSAWRQAVAAMAIRGANVATVAAGDVIQVAGIRVDVIAPEHGEDQAVMALRIVGPSGGSLCDLSEMDADAEVVAAARLQGRCDALLLPNGGRNLPVPELLATAQPRELVVSAAAARPAAGLPAGALRRTDQEGTIVVGL
jgi:competence protein ComEC